MYVGDRRKNVRVQAQQMVFRDNAAGSEVTISNTSPSPVSKVRVVWRVVRYRAPRGTDFGVSVSRQDIRRALSEDGTHVWDVIQPGGGSP